MGTLMFLIISFYVMLFTIAVLGHKQISRSYDLRSQLRELISIESAEIHAMCYPRDEDGNHIRPLISGANAFGKMTDVLDKYPARIGIRYIFRWKMETLYPDAKEEILKTSREIKSFILAWRLSGPEPTIVVNYDDINPS